MTHIKRCIYYVVGGDPEYAKMLEASVQSVRRIHHASVDIVVLTTPEYAEHIALQGVKVLDCLDKSQTAFETSMRKLDIPDYLRQYDVVLYLDCDILVTASLDPLFALVRDKTKLYAVREGGPQHHGHIFWSLLRHTCADLASFAERDMGVMNAGQFAFVPSETMYRHFAAMRTLICEHDGPYFVEQSFMNHYFASVAPDAIDWSLSGFVKLSARQYEPGFTLAHFADSSMPWHRKLELMNAWMAQQEQVCQVGRSETTGKG